ncbi:MAG: DNA-deoxyinosine glycosylase [Clostridia bacterium]|nr:DNA-deoxyinosine glycosylase [Clostridia bacterium]
MSERIVAFDPVAPPGARALILGSMPSVESLNQGFYYAHPRNAFWHILAQICNEPFPEDIPARIALLERHDLALWDVLASCERQGSLDSAIRQPAPNDFEGLFRRCPNIRRVLLNGGTAHRLFVKWGKPFIEGRELIKLPSTSPAYTLPYERKLAQWRQALNYEHESL